MLKLPEPLPYDYVDELIDSTTEFVYEEWLYDDEDPEGVVMCAWSAHRIGRQATNEPRTMYDLMDDSPYWYEEDEDGYLMSDDVAYKAMEWSAEEITEADIDMWVKTAVSSF
jgi:hypothetical protein